VVESSKPKAKSKPPIWSFAPLFLYECESCGCREERVFRDNWTGLEVCTICLGKVIKQVSLAPATEGDNLRELLEMEEDDD